MRQRQNLENEESAQKYDNLMKTKCRLEVERDEAQHGMETMTRNIEMLTKTKVRKFFLKLRKNILALESNFLHQIIATYTFSTNIAKFMIGQKK